jgi:hypothetical protein
VMEETPRVIQKRQQRYGKGCIQFRKTGIWRRRG